MIFFLKFYHEERCALVHLTLSLMVITFIIMDIYHELSEYRY